MLQITNDLIILEDIYDVLIRLKVDENNTNNYLSQIKKSGRNILMTCPFHKHGHEKKPSCGGTFNSPWFHCFTCGYVANILEIINFVCNQPPQSDFAVKWVKANFTIAYVDDRSLDSITERYKLPNNNIKYVDESELEQYRYIHPYMYQRGLTDELIQKFDVGYDKYFKLKNDDSSTSYIPCITFPVRDKSGGTLFIARRSIQGKIFHYPAEVEKPLYGIYELNKYYPTVINNEFHPIKELVICESIFNALSCWKYGVPALAMLGTGTMEQAMQIDKLNVDTLYLGLDPDIAGDKGTKRLLDRLHRNKIYIFDVPTGKDINDLTKDEFNDLPILTPSEWKNKYIKSY